MGHFCACFRLRIDVLGSALRAADTAILHILWISMWIIDARRDVKMQVSSADDVWTRVTVSLRSQLADSVWFSTFQDVVPLESDADELVGRSGEAAPREMAAPDEVDAPQGSSQ